MTNFHPDSSWDDARVADLRRLHAEGLSAGKIAKLFGVTRNAVVGKRYREGLLSLKPPSKPIMLIKGVEVYAKLRDEGVSVKEIAARYGITRNGLRSSLAKHRQAQECGPTIRNRARSADASLARKLQRLQQPKKALAPHPRRVVEPRPDMAAPASLNIPLMALTNSQCKFLLGDPRNSLDGFCGQLNFNGLPYCEFHARLCYSPETTERSRAKAGGIVAELV